MYSRHNNARTTFDSLAAMVRTDTAPASLGVLDQPTMMPEGSGGICGGVPKWRGSSWSCDADNLIITGTDVACILSRRPSKPGEPSTCIRLRLYHDNSWHNVYQHQLPQVSHPPWPKPASLQRHGWQQYIYLTTP